MNFSSVKQVISTALLTLISLLLMVPAVLLIFPFWVVSRLTAWVSKRIEPPIVDWTEIVEFHPRLGWKPKPKVRAWGLADDVYQLSTDEEGWRGKHSLDESDVVVVGDSFAFGDGVNDQDLYSDLNKSLKIKPLGACGYAMTQELLLIKEYAHRLSGKLVVWFVYLGNDLYETVTPDMQGYRIPYVRKISDGSWTIESRHLSPRPWSCSPKRRRYLQLMAELCHPGPLADRVYSAAEYVIREGCNICREAGAELVVMTIPDQTQLSRAGIRMLASKSNPDFDVRFPDRRLADICTRLGVKFVAGMDHLQIADYKRGNVHWNEHGHHTVNRLLNRLFTEFREDSARAAARVRILEQGAFRYSESA